MSDFDAELSALFTKYRTVLKPLIAEIEAQDLRFPTAVLNEIRSCFDHLSRCYNTGQPNTDENIDRAKGHISRAVLDSYKTLIVGYYDQVKKFEHENRNRDWSTVDGGRFHSRFRELQCAAKIKYIEAKSQTDSEQRWFDTCQSYRDIVLFLNDPHNVLAVAEGKYVGTWMRQLFWAVIGAVIGAALSRIP